MGREFRGNISGTVEEDFGDGSDGLSFALAESISFEPITLLRVSMVDDKCPRCRGTGDLIHMVWRYPKILGGGS